MYHDILLCITYRILRYIILDYTRVIMEEFEPALRQRLPLVGRYLHFSKLTLGEVDNDNDNDINYIIVIIMIIIITTTTTTTTTTVYTTTTTTNDDNDDNTNNKYRWRRRLGPFWSPAPRGRTAWTSPSA